MVNGAATVDRVWNFLEKLKIKLPYNPAIPLLGIDMKETKR